MYYVYKINADVTSTKENHDYYWCAYYDNVLKQADGSIKVDFNNLNKGSHDIGIYPGIDGCTDIQTIYSKNILDYEEEYNVVSTVK